MKFVLLALLALAGCTSTGALTPAAQTDVTVGCAVDGVWQPLAAAALAVVPGYGTAAASADVLLVHPLVVAACAKLGGAPAPAPVVAPVVAAPPVMVVPVIPAA